MTKRRLGRTDLDVTFVGFGALEIGRDWGLGGEGERRRPAEDEAAAVLNGVLDLGINLVDTARAYHASEERIGKAIAGRRSEFVLASKCGEHTGPNDTCYYDFSGGAIRGSIDRSLELLRTPVIDLMQIHFGPDPEKVLDDGETVKAMLEARDAGKVRFLGASPPNRLARRCIEAGVFDVLQLDYSLVDRSAGPEILRAAERGIGILVRSGFARGVLTPRVLTQPDLLPRVKPYLDLLGGDASKLPALALQFLKRNPGVSSVLAGSKSLEHVKANLEAAEGPFDPAIVSAAIRVRQDGAAGPANHRLETDRGFC